MVHRAHGRSHATAREMMTRGRKAPPARARTQRSAPRAAPQRPVQRVVADRVQTIKDTDRPKKGDRIVRTKLSWEV